MGDKADGSNLVKDKAFLTLVERMEADAESAEKQWKAQVRDTAFADFPASYLSHYKADGTQLVKASDVFTVEWNKVVAGRGDLKKLLASYDTYSGTLEALLESNARYEALIAVDISAKAQVLLTLLLAFSKFVLAHRLKKELEELERKLKKAERLVTEVVWKRRLNVLASAITFVLVPEAALAKVGLMAGSITVHVIIDNALGEGTAKGTAVFVAGDGAEAIEKLGEGGKKFFAIAAAVVTFKFDTDELHEVKEIVEEIKSDVEQVRKEYDALMAGLYVMVPKLRALDQTIKRLNESIKAAMTKAGDAGKNYDAIKKSIAKAL